MWNANDRICDWAWYTCPECGNRVKIIDGSVTWYDEIFGEKKKNIILILICGFLIGVET